MRFIMIRKRNDEEVAINTANITSVKTLAGDVCICLGGDSPISTQFTNIEAAVDYIQRAPSVSYDMRKHTKGTYFNGVFIGGENNESIR